MKNLCKFWRSCKGDERGLHEHTEPAPADGQVSQPVSDGRSTTSHVWTSADFNTTIDPSRRFPYRTEPAPLTGLQQPVSDYESLSYPYTILCRAGMEASRYYVRVKENLSSDLNIEDVYVSPSKMASVFGVKLNRAELDVVRWEWETEEVRGGWERVRQWA